MHSSELISYLDGYLNIRDYIDRSNNGLQVQGPEDITRVAFSVDSSLITFRMAVEARAQLLIVHHGLFWSEHLQITGPHFARVKTLIDHGIGLYAAHIPLDAHAEVGNNIQLARMAGLSNIQPWGSHKKDLIGFIGDLPEPMPVHTLNARLEAQIGPGNRVQGEGLCRRVAVCSGFGITLIDEAAAAGADTLLTGETSHQYHHPAAELNLKVIFGGHYNTETVGLKALRQVVTARFPVETVFLDHPTGL
jgi:dinuclear metal center YbgI/SA1388 family protein